MAARYSWPKTRRPRSNHSQAYTQLFYTLLLIDFGIFMCALGVFSSILYSTHCTVITVTLITRRNIPEYSSHFGSNIIYIPSIHIHSLPPQIISSSLLFSKVRKLLLSKKTAFSQIQVSRLANNRCLPRLEETYLEGQSLRVTYKFLNGTTLKRILRKKRLPQEAELREFTVHMLFLLSQLHEKNIELSNLKEDIIILTNNKYNQPIIFDLSSANCRNSLEYQEKRTNIYLLGVILFKIVMQRNLDFNELGKLSRWYEYSTPCYAQSQSMYHKTLFDLILKMVQSDIHATTDGLLKHQWIRDLHTSRSRRLLTIKSVSEDRMDTIVGSEYFIPTATAETFDALGTDEYGEIDRTVGQIMQEVLSKLKNPFAFRSQPQSPPGIRSKISN